MDGESTADESSKDKELISNPSIHAYAQIKNTQPPYVRRQHRSYGPVLMKMQDKQFTLKLKKQLQQIPEDEPFQFKELKQSDIQKKYRFNIADESAISFSSKQEYLFGDQTKLILNQSKWSDSDSIIPDQVKRRQSVFLQIEKQCGNQEYGSNQNQVDNPEKAQQQSQQSSENKSMQNPSFQSYQFKQPKKLIRPINVVKSSGGQGKINYQIQEIGINDLIFKNQQYKKASQMDQIVAFWKTKCIFVKVIKNQEYHPNLQNQQLGILPVFGRTKIKFFNYLVTKMIKGQNLQMHMSQFGPIKQRLARCYIRDILNGLITINKAGNSFNILTPTCVIIDHASKAWIDTTKMKQAIKVSKTCKINNFYYLSPSILLSNKNLQKNDVFSLGCIALTMILGQKIGKQHQIHPYNSQQEALNNLSKNIKQLQQKYNSILKLKQSYFKQQNKSLSRDKKLKNIRNSAKQLQRSLVQNENSKNLSQVLNNKNGEKQYSGLNFPTFSSRHQITDNTNLRSFRDSNRRKSIQVDISQQFFLFIKDCLNFDQKLRPSFKQLKKKYEFLRQNTQESQLEKEKSRQKASRKLDVLPYFTKKDIMFQKDEVFFSQDNPIQNKLDGLIQEPQIFGIWNHKNTQVRILKKKQDNKYNGLNGPGLITIYGHLFYRQKEYWVTEINNFPTLQKRIKQQQGFFSQKMILLYLRYLAKGIQIAHSNGTSFDVLTIRDIKVSEDEAWIDFSKIYTIKQILHSIEAGWINFYYLSPAILLDEKQTFKNDVWFLGTLALSFLFGQVLEDNFCLTQLIHPYVNDSILFISSVQINNKNKNKVQQILNKIHKIKKNLRRQIINHPQMIMRGIRLKVHLNNIQQQQQQTSKAIQQPFKQGQFTYSQNKQGQFLIAKFNKRKQSFINSWQISEIAYKFAKKIGHPSGSQSASTIFCSESPGNRGEGPALPMLWYR